MKIDWIGHSCFLITSQDGTTLLTDPYNGMIGKLPYMEPDIVTISHAHGDHNYLKGVGGAPLHISEAGNFAEQNKSIKGILTYHDNESGKKRGKNIAFCFCIDEINICHLGDLGHILSEEQLTEIGKVDVLLIPTGGKATIDSKTAASVTNQINPTVAIPMHYAAKRLSLTGLIFELIFEKVDNFIKASGRKFFELQELEIKNKEDLLKYEGIVVLKRKG